MSGRSIRVVFCGNDYFFSDRMFRALAESGATIVAGVLAPAARAPAGTARTRLRHLAPAALMRRAVRVADGLRLGIGRVQDSAGAAEPPGGQATSAAGASWLDYCHSRGVPVLQPRTLKTPDSATFDALEAAAPDLIVSAGYTRIMGPEILALAREGCFNFHPSPLPAYRGGSPVFFALRDGAERLGMSCHEMVPDVDEGAIAYQDWVDVPLRTTVREAYDRLIEHCAWMPRRLVEDVGAGSVPKLTQEGEPSFRLSPVEDDFEIDWALPARRIERLVCIGEGRTWTTWGSRIVRIADGRAVDVRSEGAPGAVQDVDARGIIVGCADGTAFRVEQIRFEPSWPWSGAPVSVSGPEYARALGVRRGLELGR